MSLTSEVVTVVNAEARLGSAVSMEHVVCRFRLRCAMAREQVASRVVAGIAEEAVQSQKGAQCLHTRQYPDRRS